MATFEAEWAQIRHASSGSGMTLASADDEGPDWTGSGGVQTNKAAWSAAGHGVGLLRGDIKKARTALDQAQGELGGWGDAVGGVESAVAQAAVATSWTRYLDLASGRCEALATLLEQTGARQDENTQAIEKAFQALGARYKDTANADQSQGG
ncbi:hypothetical protein HY68_07510 [Streptomyces sp. AcH 505]|uniref:hypothetical protein n=1 Tax=Streptomyces sp. AcH 505 TaxID=352211 RepID=UPI0005923A3F|nr:hypothetical protein HY68_07510 [Streptomyces sp. AcH 505]